MADNWKTDGNCSDCRKQNYCGNPCKAALIRRQEEIQHLIKQGLSKVMYEDNSTSFSKDNSTRLIKSNSETQLISSWEELKTVISPTHRIELEEEGWSAHVYEKGNDKWCKYLSTHTFYESQYVQSTISLQSYGFNVILVSWG